jgi:polyisoprenoid-binding protein YceI
MRQSIITVAVFVLSYARAAQGSSWEIDPVHTSTQFTVKHMMVTNVRGEFGKTTGVIQLDDKTPANSSVEATIDATSIDTRDPKRDGHLKSADFFDVEKYPTITFKSKKVQKVGAEKYKISGDLTLHGVTKDVVWDVVAPSKVMKAMNGDEKRGASASTKINRKDFGLLWNKPLEAGGVLVGDEVIITVDTELTKKSAATPTTAKGN